jgi:myo-inositol-1(or 4)-monophosphatase
MTRDLVYSAARGQGAWLNTKRLNVVQAELSDSSMIMLTSNLLHDKGDLKGHLPGWVCRWLSQTNWKIRILGSAALEATQVGAGVAHASVTIHGKLWDVAAPAAIVLEAGGVVTDLSGKAIFPFNLRNYSGAKVPFISAAPTAHAQLLREMKDNP